MYFGTAAVTGVKVGTCVAKKMKKKVPWWPWNGAVKGVEVRADDMCLVPTNYYGTTLALERRGLGSRNRHRLLQDMSSLFPCVCIYICIYIYVYM